jgi:CubicO group peptidase (beta-lactamase class C family)
MVRQLGISRRGLFSIAASAAACRGQGSDYDGLVQPLVDRPEFSGTVLVARGLNVLFERAYGYANIEWGVRNTIDGKYRIGSISKQFIAACVGLLTQDGRLDLDASVTRYYPEAPDAWKPITAHHLLTHTSGIPDLLGFPDFQSKKVLPAPPETSILLFRNRPLQFGPGTEGRYSNSGYILLARIVEVVSGKPFAEFLGEKVLQPLGLRNTGTDSHRAILSHRVQGYTRFRQGLGNADYIDMSVATGGGSLFSTAADLRRWSMAFHAEGFLPSNLYQRMTTPAFHNYGYGLEIRNEEGGRIIGHAGGMEGFSGFLQYRERDQLVVVVLANLNTNVTGRLANELADLARRG